jgi:hypothetical protein
MVPPGMDRPGSPIPARLVALPLVGTVVAVVAGGAVPLAAGARGPLVVVVVSSPRRYLPSSVPPQPATRMAQADTRAAARFALCIANPRPPGPLGTERCSLPA